MENRMPDTDHHKPKREEISALAHQIWEKEGRPGDRSAAHWAKAETQLRAKRLAKLKKMTGTEIKIHDFDRFPVLRSTVRNYQPEV